MQNLGLHFMSYLFPKLQCLLSKNSMDHVVFEAELLCIKVFQLINEDGIKDYEFHCFDNDFHGVAYMSAGEKLAATVIYYMTAHYNRLRVLIDSEDTSKKRILTEHNYLMECIKKREKEKYRDMLDMHLSHILNDIDDMRERYPNYFED